MHLLCLKKKVIYEAVRERERDGEREGETSLPCVFHDGDN